MTLNQTPLLPQCTRPTVSIGTGGIVVNAHYPAYQMAGFSVLAGHDPNLESCAIACKMVGAKPYATLQEMLQHCGEEVIFDLAVPGSQVESVLRQLPNHAYCLIQKPLGESAQQADQIVQICDEKGLRAAVNFQLRWAPYSLALQDLIQSGELGEVFDLEFKINVLTPWANWPFLEAAPRMEMVYHSIHYIDLMRHMWGEPTGVAAHSLNDPFTPKLESSRSTAVFAYPGNRKATIQTFHSHRAPSRHDQSYIKVEGTGGVAFVQMGLNLNYPAGGPDKFEFWRDGDPDWTEIDLIGGWFPHAFVGPMAAMMIWAETGVAPSTEVHDARKTMALVDQLYQASDVILGRG